MDAADRVNGLFNSCNRALGICCLSQEDVHRKSTDEMKKRAIHTAASYDEFRHMVSCANLTPVTSKEMATLSDKKQGWKSCSGVTVAPRKRSGNKKRQSRTSPEGSGLGTPSNSSLRSGDTLSHSIGSTRKLPSTPSEFERDWRRCQNVEDRQAYLKLVGVAKLRRLFKAQMSPDTLSEMLSVICKMFLNPPVRDPNNQCHHNCYGKNSIEEGYKNRNHEHTSIGKIKHTHMEEHHCENTENQDEAPEGGGVPCCGVDGAGREPCMSEYPDQDPTSKGGEGGDSSSSWEGEGRECLAWLKMLSVTGQFATNVEFLSEDEQRETACLFNLLSSVAATTGVGTEGERERGKEAGARVARVTVLRKAFGVKDKELLRVEE
ncbi:unnamed protein product [Choristocarpus tenellus]